MDGTAKIRTRGAVINIAGGGRDARDVQVELISSCVQCIARAAEDVQGEL